MFTVWNTATTVLALAPVFHLAFPPASPLASNSSPLPQPPPPAYCRTIWLFICSPLWPGDREAIESGHKTVPEEGGGMSLPVTGEMIHCSTYTNTLAHTHTYARTLTHCITKLCCSEGTCYSNRKKNTFLQYRPSLRTCAASLTQTHTSLSHFISTQQTDNLILLHTRNPSERGEYGRKDLGPPHPQTP